MSELVSIIIPCRNEEKFIGKCLDSIIAQDFSKDNLKVLIVDGMSDDRTGDIVSEYSRKYPFIRLIDNPKKFVPSALNTGIKNAGGKIIIRMDAHNVYENDYVSKCVRYLNEYGVDNVGGLCRTIPGGGSLIADCIAISLSHPFGVGNSYFRIGLKEPKYVDTVPFGCYKREVFEKAGLFNENLIRNQDIEFNLRLKKAGGRIILVPDIVSFYHARSTLKDLFKQNFWNGFWVIYSSRFASMPFSIRHLIPLLFVSSLLGSLALSIYFKPFFYLFALIAGSYLITGIFYSFKLSLKKRMLYFIPLMASFATLHFSYGLGSIVGIVKLALPYKRAGNLFKHRKI